MNKSSSRNRRSRSAALASPLLQTKSMEDFFKILFLGLILFFVVKGFKNTWTDIGAEVRSAQSAISSN